MADLSGQLQTVENECGAESRCAPAVELCHQIAAVNPGSRLRLDRRL